ncbi:DUF3017 domain-containing protein [Streptomyces sp. NPDC058307]|uniref:DUF3017 domain-containing protein n=1 Tax=Streptomyces sp. NPDC058307 TaxID=3346439 RepID=UPI0036DFF20E
MSPEPHGPEERGAAAGATAARESGSTGPGSQETGVASVEAGEPVRATDEDSARDTGRAEVPSDAVPDSTEQDELVVRDPISAPDADGRPRRVTRRFPLFTRDTAQPEGGGRAAPRDAPAPARQWPVLAVLAVVGLGLLLTALDRFRLGTLLIGVALLAGAVLRWLLPDVGMLAVRSRFTDIATYGVLGAAIVLLAMMVQPHPWLEIPFLKDTLHFTVSSS